MMKKLIFTARVAVLASLVLSPSLVGAAGAAAPRSTAAAAPVQEKRCEKCKRGVDGKMVCEAVPCPPAASTLPKTR